MIAGGVALQLDHNVVQVNVISMMMDKKGGGNPGNYGEREVYRRRERKQPRIKVF